MNEEWAVHFIIFQGDFTGIKTLVAFRPLFPIPFVNFWPFILLAAQFFCIFYTNGVITTPRISFLFLFSPTAPLLLSLRKGALCRPTERKENNLQASRYLFSLEVWFLINKTFNVTGVSE